MKKWLLRILYAALVLLPIGAIADYTATPGSGSTVFAFVCFTSKICPAHVLTNSSGTEIATSGNPVRTDPTGTTPQPVTVASGAVASGAYAAGSLASGAGVDGWDLTQGAKSDTAWVSGSGSTIAILKNIAGGVAGAIPAGTAIIGKVGIDQTTPGTTNGVQEAATGATGSTAPTKASQIGVVDQVGGNLTALEGDPCQTTAKSYLPITATTSLVKVIATGVTSKKIYICQLLLTVTAADNVAVFEATTGTTCATSAVAVYGAGTAIASAANGFPFPANGGVSLGNGSSMVGQTTVNNNDLCIGTSAATPLTGGITYVTR